LLLAVSLAAGVALGLIPLVHGRADAGVLREGGRGLTISRGRVAVRGALVVAQVALALVLLAGAGLMFRSFDRLRAVRLGFEPDGVATMAVSLPSARYHDYERATAFYEQLSQRLAAVPGIESVGFSGQIPLTGKEGCTGVFVDQPGSTGIREKCITTQQASPGYFETIRNRVQGRTPDWNETRQGAAGVVITRALADVFWPGEDAIGRGVRCCGGISRAYYRIVGVADDVHDGGLDEPPMQAVFFPLMPIADSPIEERPLYMHLVVRAPGMDAGALLPIVQRAVAELDPQVPVANPRSMDDVVARSMAKRTVTLMLLGIAAAMALLLSAVGLYGVVSYVVGQRRGEIGIRLALGARASQVASLVLRQSLALVSLGVLIGLAGAVAGTRVLRGLLFEVSPTDPLVLAGVSLLLIALAVAASLVPTRRALRVDPLDTLRAE
jgi:predicted permease